MIDFKSFPDIESFHNVVKSAGKYGYENPTVEYRGKIKLHGTNAGVRIKGGEVAAQSRSRIITPADDNAGFAAWVESRKDWFLSLDLEDAVIFGEWCGPGIMKGTAINQIPNKVFAVFAIFSFDGLEEGNVFREPLFIDSLLTNRPDDVHVIPWYTTQFPIYFDNRTSLSEMAEALTKITEGVEVCDPWVEEAFGVKGIGEGVVWYPVNADSGRKFFSDFIFKTKGEKHKVTKEQKLVHVDPEVAASIADFVKMFVTEPRLEQGVANTGAVDMKNMGPFLKWFCGDVEKESKAELEASGLKWDEVAKDIQVAARNWYKAKAQEIA